MTSFGAGMAGGAVFSIVLWVLRVLGVTHLSVEKLIGVALLDSLSAGAWIAGLVTHLMIAGALGWLYAGGFRRIHLSGLAPCLLFSLFQWAALGALIGLLPDVAVSGGYLVLSPGSYASRTGSGSVFAFLLANLAFGLVFGALYDRRTRYPSSNDEWLYNHHPPKAA